MRKLDESPDEIEFEDGSMLFYNNGESYAFGYAVKKMGTLYNINEMKPKFGKNTKLLVSDMKDIHGDIHRNYDVWDKFSRDTLLYPGRIWLDYHVISFWEYPKGRHKRQVLEDLENYFNIKIIGNSEWVVEIEYEEFETATSYATDKDVDYAKWKRTQHVKAGRFGRKVPDGVGSETKKYGDLSVSQAHQMMRTSEDRLRKIIKQIINEIKRDK